MSVLPNLVGNGVVLRGWEIEDAPDLHREIQDPEIVRWLNIGLPYTVDDAETFISSSVGQWESREAAHFAITDPSGGFVGYVGVLAVDKGMGVVEVVYWIGSSHRGKGLAGRALRVLIPWIVETIRPERIELGLLEGNSASASTAESAGFVLRESRDISDDASGEPLRELIYEYDPGRQAELGSPGHTRT